MVSSFQAPSLVTIEGVPVSFRRIGAGSRKILFFNGFSGSSTQIEFFRPYLDSSKLEVICVDRPGYFKSGVPTASNQLEATTIILEKFLTQLGWQTCELFSVSGGTPFLFSFLRTFPERVSHAIVMSGLGPFNSPAFAGILKTESRLSLRFIGLIPAVILRRILKVSGEPAVGLFARGLEKLLALSPPDLQALQKNPWAVEVLNTALEEGYRQNGLGPQRDAKAFLIPWTIERGNYSGGLEVWHGEEDFVLPIAMAEKVASLFSGAKLHRVEKEGHYSMAIHQIGRILSGSAGKTSL
jgi:pimeloyl-ACP methyl ester carboxylesterase